MMNNVSNSISYVSKNDLQYFKKNIKSWYQNNARVFPWRKTKNPYKILIAEILLQKTDVLKVVSTYETILTNYPDVDSLAKARLKSLQNTFSKIGLVYRAERLHKIANIVNVEYGGCIPARRDELLNLPGVGMYTANSICSCAYDQKYEIVDTNVIRIFDRFFNIKSDNKRPRNDKSLWLFARSLLPQKRIDTKHWNWALLDISALICKNYNPRCNKCPLMRKCNYYKLSINQ